MPRPTRAHIASLVAGFALLGAAPAASVGAASSSPQAVTAKRCSSGYTHAVLPSGHKCLRAGQSCSRKVSAQRVYRDKGFVCPANRRLKER